MNKWLILIISIAAGAGIYAARSIQPLSDLFSGPVGLADQFAGMVKSPIQSAIQWLETNKLGVTVVAVASTAVVTGVTKYVYGKITERKQNAWLAEKAQMQENMLAMVGEGKQMKFKLTETEQSLAQFDGLREKMDALQTERDDFKILAEKRLDDYNALERLYSSILKVKPPQEMID